MAYAIISTIANAVGREDVGAIVWDKLSSGDRFARGQLATLSTRFAGLLPSYASIWIDTVVARPILSAGVASIVLGLYQVSGALRGRIEYQARSAWFPNECAPSATPSKGLAKRVDG